MIGFSKTIRFNSQLHGSTQLHGLIHNCMVWSTTLRFNPESQGLIDSGKVKSIAEGLLVVGSIRWPRSVSVLARSVVAVVVWVKSLVVWPGRALLLSLFEVIVILVQIHVVFFNYHTNAVAWRCLVRRAAWIRLEVWWQGYWWRRTSYITLVGECLRWNLFGWSVQFGFL